MSLQKDVNNSMFWRGTIILWICVFVFCVIFDNKIELKKSLHWLQSVCIFSDWGWMGVTINVRVSSVDEKLALCENLQHLKNIAWLSFFFCHSFCVVCTKCSTYTIFSGCKSVNYCSFLIAHYVFVINK